MLELAATALLFALSAAPAAPDAISAAAYPGARSLLERTVEGRSIRIRFRCLATSDPLEKVASCYANDPRFSRAKFRGDPDERTFALKSDPELHVAVFPAANAALHRQCGAPLEPGEKTLLQISQSSPR